MTEPHSWHVQYEYHNRSIRLLFETIERVTVTVYKLVVILSFWTLSYTLWSLDKDND